MSEKVFRVNPELLKRCYEHYSLACEELDKIEKIVKEYAKSLEVELTFREDTFNPFWIYEIEKNEEK